MEGEQSSECRTSHRWTAFPRMLDVSVESMTADCALRAGIIGCGQIAGGYDEGTADEGIQTHAKAYLLHPATKLVAVADRDRRCAQEFSTRWGNPVAYSDASGMLAAESLDIVSICTPDDSHAIFLEMCLDCPGVKAVWCEKPLTTDVRSAETIVSEYARRGIILVVNYQRRWQPQMDRVKNALQEGHLGKVQKAVVYYTKGVLHNGSHAIDLLLDWFGLPTALQVYRSHVDFAEEDPTVDGCLQFGNVPVYLFGVDERAYSLFEIHIFGTMGRVTVKCSGREVDWFDVGSDRQPRGNRGLRLREAWVQTGGDRAMAHVLQDIIESISSRESVRSNGMSALATLRVCQQLVLHAKEKL